MSLKYRLIQRVNPRDPKGPRHFYAKAVGRGDVTLRELADEIAQISTVSTVDTMAAIEALIQIIPKHVAQGEVVRLGDFGSYTIGILSAGTPDEEEFTPEMIKGVKLYFRPGRELKNALRDIRFEKERRSA